MYPVAHITCDIRKSYESSHWLTKIKEKYSTSIIEENFIKDLGLRISKIALPANYNHKRYLNNIQFATKRVSRAKVYLAPETWRLYDYGIYNSFQKRMFAHSVIESTKLLLRVCGKSIKNSCIAIYDACDEINKVIIEEAAKNCRYIILVSKNMDKLNKLCNYIISEYGTSPVITNDIEHSIKTADFVISSRKVALQRETFLWCVDNNNEEIQSNKIINGVAYKVPWQLDNSYMSPQLLGAILCQMDSRGSMEDIIRQNGIYLDSIMYNERVINL